MNLRPELEPVLSAIEDLKRAPLHQKASYGDALGATVLACLHEVFERLERLENDG